MERGGWKPHVEICPACPRCGSSNTKFCYYNNYSLTQPRYFCKGCRRYWTKGGSLRNVPVGGGCRKTRRTKSVRIARHGAVSSRFVSSCNSMPESSSTNPSTSNNIDLAAVYANFLNQQPQENIANDINTQVIMNPLPNIPNHPLFEFSSNLGMEFFGGAQESCMALSDWSSLDTDYHSRDMLYICGLESAAGHQKQHNITSIAKDQQIISDYELPPLPGDQAASNDNQNQIANSMQLLGFEKEVDLDPSSRDEFIGNPSMFDGLPTYGTSHNFPRP